MAVGRPTKYSPELVAKAKDYYKNYSAYGDMIPSIVGLAVALDLCEATLYNWDNEDHPEFLGILDKIKTKQHQVLINNGLSGDFNAQITKLVLGKHGYKESTANEVTGANGGPIETKWTVEIVGAKP